jgi:hypothetical protein
MFCHCVATTLVVVTRVLFEFESYVGFRQLVLPYIVDQVEDT